MIATVVLGRVLAPSDFGVATMATTFSMMLNSVGLNGFTEAVVQAEAMDHRLASSLFWINAGIGTVLTLAFAASGSMIARFFDEPRVTGACVLISAWILLTSISVIHLALLKRAMRFAAVSRIEIVGRLVQITASIGLGAMGWGYWALLAGIVAGSLTSCLQAWIACRWMPGLPSRASGLKSMVQFAAHIYGHFLVNYVGLNTDNMLVGWRYHAESLGFYKRAFDLFVLPTTQISGPIGVVAMSALSKFRNDPEQLRRHVLSLMSMFALVGMAISGTLTLVGKDLIRVLLGDRWDESGRIFLFFGPGIGVMLIYAIHGWIHVALGKADRWFRWGLIELATTVALLVAFLPWGPSGIASAWSLSFWVLFLPGFWYAGKPMELGITAPIGAVWRYMVASLLAGLSTAALVRQIAFLGALSGTSGSALRAVLVSLLFSVLYFVFIVVLYRGFSPFYKMWRLMREFLPERLIPKIPTRVKAAVSGLERAL
jgi:PST family polysaccharide transporter